jgi:methyl-accepting chemotaxis protein
VAGDSNIKSALVAHDKVQLYKYAADYMVSQKTYSLVIASVSGEVLMRAEDRDRTNDSVSSDPLVASALGGNEMATVSYDSGISVPVISIKAAVPIRQGGQSSNDIVGVALSNFTIDSTFVDSVKTVTGLDIAVFGGDKRAATTFIAPDGKSRYVGTLETNKKVLDTVLSKGQLYIGAANVLNQPFYTAYAPLKTQENRVVGMLFVGKLQNTLTDAAHKSIDLTLLGSIVLILVSLIPAFLFSRFLKEQLEA